MSDIKASYDAIQARGDALVASVRGIERLTDVSVEDNGDKLGGVNLAVYAFADYVNAALDDCDTYAAALRGFLGEAVAHLARTDDEIAEAAK